MSELDEAWELALTAAQQRARDAGRGEIAEYLRLRSSNDLQRRTGIKWLLATFARLAGEANRLGAGLQTSSELDQRFSINHATMVGPRLTLTYGVRYLTIEAGWPRVPSDSFVRGGGLALARVKHFGKPIHDQDLQLVRIVDQPPHWEVTRKNGSKARFIESDIQSHLTRLLSPDYK